MAATAVTGHRRRSTKGAPTARPTSTFAHAGPSGVLTHHRLERQGDTAAANDEVRPGERSVGARSSHRCHVLVEVRVTVSVAGLRAAKLSEHVAHLRQGGARVLLHAVERRRCLRRARVSGRARRLHDQRAHALHKFLYDARVEPVAFLEPGGAHLGCPLLSAHCGEPSQLAHLLAARGHQGTTQRRTADEHGEEEQVVGDGVDARIGHLARQGQQPGVDQTPQRCRDRTQPGAGRKTCSHRHQDRRRGVHEVRADREVEKRSAGGHRQQRNRRQPPVRDSHLGHGMSVGRASITGHHSREGRRGRLVRPILVA